MHTLNSTSTIPIIGVWSLVSFELRQEAGDVIYPFGQDAHGTILYTNSGRFSAQLMRGNRPRFASPDQMKGALPEIEAAFKGTISYYGSFTFNADRGTVIHHVEGSLFPNWEGQSLKRFFKITEDRLELSTPPTIWGGGGTIVGVIQWKKEQGMMDAEL